MPVKPHIVERPQQPYAAIPVSVTMSDFGELAPPLIGEVAEWLASRGAAPAGAPFFRYRVIDMARALELEVGFPTATVVAGAGRVHSATLPGGRYATLVHQGHPSELVDVTAELLAWADDEGLRWDVRDSSRGEQWGCRMESSLTDPRVEPDMSKWETQLSFRLADG
ncbi:MAG TPA: GyrI-like domain-containing protein [Stackebrandtia sp.]|jgi:effector-binding domain-containing protein|uniref:GyrI-like domain-containing protein n=1 Tax=Stackebrandtia sp. TaxID=2023065 RepID=UPI002D318B3D|nr:GyrI-like domain-containing protein [Stackebrandtia sp.]HZE37226.1 GyrI-like domain-containing protein [Stackebrandtia sp.]